MTKTRRTKLPVWLSLDAAREIALGHKPHPSEGMPAFASKVTREQRKKTPPGMEHKYRARVERDMMGPNVLVEWFTGDSDRGNKWTLKLPAQQVLELASWIVQQEPDRRAWWDWLDSSEKTIQREAKNSGITLNWRDVLDIRDQIVSAKESLFRPADIVEFSKATKGHK